MGRSRSSSSQAKASDESSGEQRRGGPSSPAPSSSPAPVARAHASRPLGEVRKGRGARPKASLSGVAAEARRQRQLEEMRRDEEEHVGVEAWKHFKEPSRDIDAAEDAKSEDPQKAKKREDKRKREEWRKKWREDKARREGRRRGWQAEADSSEDTDGTKSGRKSKRRKSDKAGADSDSGSAQPGRGGSPVRAYTLKGAVGAEQLFNAMNKDGVDRVKLKFTGQVNDIDLDRRLKMMEKSYSSRGELMSEEEVMAKLRKGKLRR